MEFRTIPFKILSFQELGLPLQSVQALALGHVGPNGDHEIEEESGHHERQHGRPRREPDAPPSVSGDGNPVHTSSPSDSTGPPGRRP